MRNKTEYEWCYEIVDEHGDIIDNNFSDKLDFINPEGELVLVVNIGNEMEGVVDRFWAYVKDGKLAEYFQDGAGHEVNFKVPEKFHKQLAKYLQK